MKPDCEKQPLVTHLQPTNPAKNRRTIKFHCADKKANLAGLQFADLIARPIGNKYLHPNSMDRSYQILEPKIRRGLREKMRGVMRSKSIRNKEEAVGGLSSYRRPGTPSPFVSKLYTRRRVNPKGLACLLFLNISLVLS